MSRRVTPVKPARSSAARALASLPKRSRGGDGGSATFGSCALIALWNVPSGIASPMPDTVQAKRPPGASTRNFGERAFRLGEVQHAEAANHAVDARIGQVDRFGVADRECDGRIATRRLVDHRLREVEPAHGRAARGGFDATAMSKR